MDCGNTSLSVLVSRWGVGVRPQGFGRAEWEFLMIGDFLDEVVEGGNSGDSGMALIIH